jgi:O-antigen/teichoic acid export membrane protein
VIVVIGQLAGNLIAVFSFRSSFPQLRLRFSSVSGGLLKEMMSYGIHSFVANISNLLLYQGPPVIIAHFRTAAFVGYYMLPFRLLQYLVDAVTRVGFVTRSNVAEMQATGEERGIYNMTMLLNRYCAMLFMPAVAYLLVYGTDLVRKWISPEYAANSGPLLPIMAVTVLIAVAGQYNSGSALYGMARHNLMARGLLVESVAGAVGLALVLPHYGLIGAAWTVGVLSVLNRGLYVAWLTCSALHESFLGFVTGIYLRPLLTAIPVLALLFAVKAAGVSGATWLQLISVAVLTGILYFALSAFTCVTAEHRGVLLDWVAKHLPVPKRNSAAAR